MPESTGQLRRPGVGALALALAALPILACLAPAQAGPRVRWTCPGDDWSLPGEVVATKGTGLFTMGVASRYEPVAMRGFTKTWAELAPGPGRYDWSPVREILERAEAEDFGVVLRLKASVTERGSPWGGLRAVPDWVLEQYDPPRGRTRDRGPQDYIEVAVPWHPGLEAAYLAFVEAFGRESFARDPRLVGVYVHGISSSFGEELWLDASGYHAMADLGLTPEQLQATFAERLRAWADAFGAERGKLAWVGAGWIDAGEKSGDFRRASDRIDALALEIGLGRRWGNVERYNGQLDELGQSLGADGHLVTDPAHPLVAGRRFFGGENENWRGEPEREAFAYRRAVLRALQMRMRQLWVSDRGIALDPEITAYFAQVAGKGPSEAPDAWAVLRATEARRGRHRLAVGNLERWLHQDEEAPHARSRPVRPVRRPPQANDWSEPVEWSARSTRRAEGDDRLAFDLETTFAGEEPTPLALLVTWFDTGARWRLELGDGALRSGSVQGSGDGREKTTTLALDTFEPRPLGPDLSLVAESGDLEVSVVRVLRRLPEEPGCAGGEGREAPRA